jgi:hypothetical protein
MSQFSEETQQILDSLRDAVTETLERKRRLGHYAVIWQDGKLVAIGEDAPEDLLPKDNGHITAQEVTP